MIVKNAGELDNSSLDVLQQVGQGFASKISRGITFYFSWLDAEANPDFSSTLGTSEYPQIVVLNPGKRKRFIVHEGPI